MNASILFLSLGIDRLRENYIYLSLKTIRVIINEGNLSDSIVYGPGQLTLAHKSDEHIELEDYLNGMKIMALAMALLLGVEEK